MCGDSKTQPLLLDVEAQHANGNLGTNSCNGVVELIKFIINFDLIFLKYSFVSDFEEDENKASHKVSQIIRDVKQKLDIATDEQQYPWLELSTRWYFEYLLAPTTFLVEKFNNEVLCTFMLGVTGCVAYSAYCFTQLVPEPRELGTFQRLEHSPMSGIIMLLCTHFICVMFTYYNLTRLRSSDKPKLAFPLLYCFFVGKGFMVLRMILSYSSGQMGTALEYFIYQEIILTVCHGAGSFLIVEAPDDEKPEFGKQIRDCIGKVLMVDGVKTVVIALFWLNFEPGRLADLVNRMPSQTSQIAFALVVHFVMDMVQSGVTFFTVYLGKWGTEVRQQVRSQGVLSAVDQLIKHILAFDMIFLKNTFDSSWDEHTNIDRAGHKVGEMIQELSIKLSISEEERKYPVLEFCTTWYMQCFLAPTTFLVEKYKKAVLASCLAVTVGCVAYTSYCLTQLVSEPRELNTFQLLEHSPMSGVILVFCTHFICSMFSYYNLTRIRASAKPKLALPLLYCFFVGKGFMAMRMVLAYSSGKMGVALDYFFWQEIILTVCHGAGSFLFVGAPDEEKPNFAKQIRDCMGRVLMVDGGKTIVIALFWLTFQPGWFAQLVDRMPSQQSQVVFALVVHFVMDMVQSFVTFFTVYLGKWGRSVMEQALASTVSSDKEAKSMEALKDEIDALKKQNNDLQDQRDKEQKARLQAEQQLKAKRQEADELKAQHDKRTKAAEEDLARVSVLREKEAESQRLKLAREAGELHRQTEAWQASQTEQNLTLRRDRGGSDEFPSLLSPPRSPGNKGWLFTGASR